MHFIIHHKNNMWKLKFCLKNLFTSETFTVAGVLLQNQSLCSQGIECLTQGQFDSASDCGFDLLPIQYRIATLNKVPAWRRLTDTRYSTTQEGMS